MPKLAINGGEPIRREPLPSQKTWGIEETVAAARVIEGDCLTGYQGNWGPGFRGGPEVQALECEFAGRMNVKHAIAVNSCTSGLHVALKAAGVEPGEEVIVTPYSMTCSASLPLAWGATPVFADVEPRHFCLDPDSVRRAVTPNTKAILIVDLFGQPYNYPDILQIAEDNHLLVIEDAAQAIGSFWGAAPAGTLGDMGVFSLNQGKHITCGEGGMIVTDNDELAMACRLIANHGESVLNDYERNRGLESDFWMDHYLSEHPTAFYGFNLRLPEISAAITRVQLGKLDEWLDRRRRNVLEIELGLKDIPAIEPAPTRQGCIHSYYCQPFLWDGEQAGVHRNVFIEAVRAELQPCAGREQEGVPIGGGYIKPIHLMPLFRELPHQPMPVVENLWREELFIIHRLIGPMADPESLNDVIEAFHKVWNCRRELK